MAGDRKRVGLRGLRQRQREEGSSRLARDGDRSAVPLDDGFGDGQAEAAAIRSARAGGVDLVEPLEHVRQVRRRNADARIEDGEDERAAFDRRAYLDRAAV